MYNAEPEETRMTEPKELTHELFCEIYNQLLPQHKKQLEEFINAANKFQQKDQDRARNIFYMMNSEPSQYRAELTALLKKNRFPMMKIQQTFDLL